MPAARRAELAGAIHHVANRGTRRSPIFYDEYDRRFFLRRLNIVAERHKWRCLTYCLMTNHVHLVVETLEPTLGAGMRDLESLHARVFNDRHGHEGTTLERRYRSRLVDSDEYFAQLLRYVALNPVKAGLVADARDWVWSAHAALLGHRADGCVDAARVTELLEPWGGEPAERYHRLFDPDGPLATTYGDADPGTWRPALRDLLRAGDRAAAINAARRHGYRLVEIAVELQVSEATVSRWARGLGGPTIR